MHLKERKKRLRGTCPDCGRGVRFKSDGTPGLHGCPAHLEDNARKFKETAEHHIEKSRRLGARIQELELLISELRKGETSELREMKQKIEDLRKYVSLGVLVKAYRERIEELESIVFENTEQRKTNEMHHSITRAFERYGAHLTANSYGEICELIRTRRAMCLARNGTRTVWEVWYDGLRMTAIYSEETGHIVTFLAPHHEYKAEQHFVPVKPVIVRSVG